MMKEQKTIYTGIPDSPCPSTWMVPATYTLSHDAATITKADNSIAFTRPFLRREMILSKI